MADATEIAVPFPSASDRSRASIGFIFGSVLLHAVGFLALDIYVKTRPLLAVQKPVELVMFEIPKPAPPPPPPEEAPKPPPKEKLKIRTAAPKTPPPPKDDAPPPPNDPAPEPTKPVPLVVGLSLSSTTATGGFAAPVGNTSYGKADQAVAPHEVKAYAAKRYVPAYQLDGQPAVLSEMKPEYSEQARQAGIEGQVVVAITIDPDGTVSNAKLIRGLGYGLDDAALKSIRRYRFKPAIKGGEAVSTTINFTITFLLD